MRHWLLAATLTSLLAMGDFVVQTENIAFENGGVTSAPQETASFSEDFKVESGLWLPFVNFENKLTFERTIENDLTGLAILNKQPQGSDTAWELISKSFAVTPKAAFRLVVVAQGNVSMTVPKGHKGMYETRIAWFDKDGKELPSTYYGFKVSKRNPVTTEVVGTVPESAVSASIHLGADSPNINPVNKLIINQVTFLTRKHDDPLVKNAFLELPPVKLQNLAYEWNATVPNNCALHMLLSFAESEEGPWTPFAGPAPNQYYTQPKGTIATKLTTPWCKAKFVLVSDGKQAPLLRSLTLGNQKMGNWVGVDKEEPKLTMITPGLVDNDSTPILFKITDNQAPNWSTFKAWINGNDITENIVRKGDTCTYTPETTYPTKTWNPALDTWNQSPYQNSVTFTALKESRDGIRIAKSDEYTQSDTAFAILSAHRPVEPGKTYEVTYELRHTVNLGSFMGEEKSSYCGSIRWFDANGNETGTRVRFPGGDKQDSWKSVTVKGVAPEQAISLKVVFGFDTPNFELGDFLEIKNVALTGPSPSKALPRSSNLHSLRIYIEDWSGNKLDEDAFFLVGKRLQKNVASLRDDGFVLIDGKPFFPIGMYAVCPREFNGNSIDKAFEGLAAAGFNLAHTYSSGRGKAFTEFLDTAAKYGFKVYVASHKGANSTDIAAYLEDVERERHHPAAFAWYLADDTSAHVKHDDLQKLHDAIKRIDPDHITVQADGTGARPRSNYIQYVHATDGFLPEIYPVTEHQKGVSKVITDMKTIHADIEDNGSPVKTIWAIIQYFDGWGWTRFPTFNELRAMSYLSIIHGAHGITWYTYGGFNKNRGVTSSPERWNNICTVATELSKLSPIFLERTGPQLPPPEILQGDKTDNSYHSSISVLLKVHDGKRYVIAANSSNSQVTCTIKTGGKLAKTWFEDGRTIAIQNDLLKDTFEAYGVHVYELED